MMSRSLEVQVEDRGGVLEGQPNPTFSVHGSDKQFIPNCFQLSTASRGIALNSRYCLH
jgi:hypothetical protein